MHEIIHRLMRQTSKVDRHPRKTQKGTGKLKVSKNLKADFFNVLKLFYLLLILLILLSTATYTWFSLSRAPKINDMTLYVSTASGLEIAYDLNAEDGEWGQSLLYSDIVKENTVLRPITYSDTDDTFYAAVVGTDGRIIAVNQPLDDERHTNRNDVNGYYVKFSFYARTNENVSVELSSADPTGEYGTYVVGMPEWNSDEVYHNNGGKGLEEAMRVGFRITKYDALGNVLDEAPKMIVYEPNCNVHLDYTREYYKTPSIDGTENLVPEERLIRQKSTAWIEASPVQKNVLIYEHGEFVDETHLFDLEAGQKVRIDVYLWLEGQDADCRFETNEAAKILAALQFWSESSQHSGMDPIE